MVLSLVLILRRYLIRSFVGGLLFIISLFGSLKGVILTKDNLANDLGGVNLLILYSEGVSIHKGPFVRAKANSALSTCIIGFAWISKDQILGEIRGMYSKPDYYFGIDRRFAHIFLVFMTQIKEYSLEGHAHDMLEWSIMFNLFHNLRRIGKAADVLFLILSTTFPRHVGLSLATPA
ncbi:hypothetical protein ACJX0J_032679 [Zea mays]